jgi:hypothetical protein
VYKIGITINIEQKIKDLNNYYQCCGKIIIIFCARIEFNFVEKLIHTKLKIYNYNKKHDLIDPLKSKPTELYKISSELYDEFNNLLLAHSTEYFESNYYVINDNNTENICVTNNELSIITNHYITYHKINNSTLSNQELKKKFITDEYNPHILLDKNIAERIFWINLLIGKNI